MNNFLINQLEAVKADGYSSIEAAIAPIRSLPPIADSTGLSARVTSFGALRKQVEAFDLAPWGLAAGDRVGLLIANGAELASTLLSVMATSCSSSSLW